MKKHFVIIVVIIFNSLNLKSQELVSNYLYNEIENAYRKLYESITCTISISKNPEITFKNPNIYFIKIIRETEKDIDTIGLTLLYDLVKDLSLTEEGYNSTFILNAPYHNNTIVIDTSSLNFSVLIHSKKNKYKELIHTINGQYNGKFRICGTRMTWPLFQYNRRYKKAFKQILDSNPDFILIHNSFLLHISYIKNKRIYCLKL